MSGAIRLLLPPHAAHLVPTVLEAGCTPVVDAVGQHPPVVPDGAWVRTRPGRPAPGTGPVILAELGAPVGDRPTWLETAVPRDVPAGYAGLVLKGREAGGFAGEEDGLAALAACPEPGRVILDAGVGPATAGAAAALGAAGVLLVEQHLACPEIGLPPALARRLQLADDEVTRVVAGVRVANPATALVLRELVTGGDPWLLAEGIWDDPDPGRRLWMVGQGLALAAGLADRYGTLSGLLAAYVAAWEGWVAAARKGALAPAGGTASRTGAQLGRPGSVAVASGPVGSAVLWQQAVWLGRPIGGEPLVGALATGAPVVADGAKVDAVRKDLPEAPAVAEPAREEPAKRDVAASVGAAAPGSLTTPASEEAPAIAIIGVGCRFPGASSVDEYWENILAGKSAIGEVPKDRWDPALFWDPDAAATDKTYARIGGFLRDFKFDAKRFRIPPKVVPQIDAVQQITLACVADALEDAGLQVDSKSPGKPFDRQKCAVILGNSLGGEMSDVYAIRVAWPGVRARVEPSLAHLQPADREKILREMEVAYKLGLPDVTEDSMPGELANVIAGRIANAFDLGGANFTVDAACASSMAAFQSAVAALQHREADMVVTGGADRSMNVATYVKFSKIGALSPDHSSPFDASANGFVMGEGCGILVMKRLEDAVRDGDRIYALVRGIGASSDGKGKGITAPNIQGQIRALKRAYEAAGVDPADIDLVECHGTSTVVGDKVEVEALTEVIGPNKRGGRGPIRIGSVKSQIGHLKSAAGAASAIKTALALYHGVLPPSINFKQARPDLPLDVIPAKVQTVAEPWPLPPSGIRRAGVSAFGFGGTNFHMVLESWAGQIVPSHREIARTTDIARPVYTPPAQIAPTPEPAPAPVAMRPPAGPAPKPAPPPVQAGPALPDGIWATSANDQAGLVENLKAIMDGRPAPWNPSAPLRIAAAAMDADERKSQLERAISTLEKGGNPDILRSRAIYLEDGPVDGDLALLFTGQGSQYVGMGFDLAEAYPIVAETFAEADAILAPKIGKPITDLMRLLPGEDEDAKEDLLKQTEFSQPATLTLDVAIMRLLAAFGVHPDMVAGHSLGEYGAAVAAGVMTFEQSLQAVSARGREMANIQLEDAGKMAGVAASAEAVDSVLAEVDGYVIAANKNCPSQTVIAGASDAVDDAVERFKARGVTVQMLAVSHAFHSQIVAPASEPLKGVLQNLGLKAPVRPITTNVTGEYYPSGPTAVPQIIDLLARQISAPVEWTAQMERMYADGARVFVECGPKRALSGFTVAILKRRAHRALYTNHPKRGGVASFRDALAGLVAAGFPIKAVPAKTAAEIDLFADPAPRMGTSDAILGATDEPTQTEPMPDLTSRVLEIVAQSTGYGVEELDLDYELEADLGIDTVKQAEVFGLVRQAYGIGRDDSFDVSKYKTLRAVIGWAAERSGNQRIAVESPAPVAAPSPAPAPVAPARAAAQPAPAQAAPARAAPAPALPADQVAKFVEAAARAGMQGSDAEAFTRALLPAIQGLFTAAVAAAAQVTPLAPARAEKRPVEAPKPAVTPAAPIRVKPTKWSDGDLDRRVVCTGASLGLPGGKEVFDADNIPAMLRGENRIAKIGDRAKPFLDLGLVRLVKDSKTGQGSFLPVAEESQVIRLAGLRGKFDLKEWGIADSLVDAFDVTTQLSIAAGLEAMRDAGLPLVRQYKVAANGKRMPQGWALPPSLRDGTGVIFASAFPGYDRMVEKIGKKGADGDGNFDRRFLFQVLAMGHSQFAQLIGARGPNTAVNAACASTTQAIAMAADWIRLGRAERVIVVGADDVTSERMFPWIGGGFMAAGAASTSDVVEEAALPFDRRRHGLILGMGAAGLVMESAESAARRGMTPLAELSGATMVNSAFHGTRLDGEHIAEVVVDLVKNVCEKEGITPSQLADRAVFMSHETYTPARGGSAGAEIAALRKAFGPAASRIPIANTKGFTGHPMGAGIEDTVALKAMQYGKLPPIANFKEPDDELGDLRLSKGEHGDFQYCLRLAAGFGSQLAVSLWKRLARGDERVFDPARRTAWLQEISGFAHTQELVDERTLRLVEAEGPPATVAKAETVVKAEPVAPMAAVAPPAPQGDATDYLAELIELVAGKTGYEPSELEPDFELEADLGIDTVKQAEILGVLTDRFGLVRDDSFRISDYPTLRALAAYVAKSVGADAPPPTPPPAKAPAPVAATPAPAPAAVAKPAPAPAPATVAKPAAPAGKRDTLADLVAVVAEKTGYEPSELEPGFELEADLGVDTVKQAEILGALRERYGLAQDDAFRLGDYPTLEKLAAYLDARRTDAPADAPAPAMPTPSTAPVAPKAAPQAAAPAPAPAPAQPATGGSTLADLTEVVAEKTGYDVSELEPGFELEADLGVDTVKQAEILGALRERYGLAQDDAFRLSDYPTLEKLAAYLDGRRGAPAPAAPTPAAEAPTVVPAAPPTVAAPAAAAPRADAGPGLPSTFRVRRPILVDWPAGRPGTLAGKRVRILGSGAIADAVRAELGRRGALLDGAPWAVLDVGTDVMQAFRLARELDGQRPERWVTLTRLGGLVPSVSPSEALAEGARAGFTKSLGREWECAARVLDVEWTLSDIAIAAIVCDELATDDAAVEIFRDGRRRRTIQYSNVTPPSHGRLEGWPVVLLTGGGRGITARIATELAHRGRVRLALAGRGAPLDRVLDEKAEKERIKASLAAAGERTTPARIDAELNPLRRADEVRANIEALRAAGAEVQYFRADLADPEAAFALVKDVEAAFGPVDVVVHGAGVEESRPVADKDETAFHRVYDGKAVGGEALATALGVQAWFVSMGSVAGRFGNPGQVDYAAANDGLARLCLARPRSLHVDWTAWDDVGMAVRGGMRHLLTERGVQLLPADAGARLLVDLLVAGIDGELVVSGELGDLAPPKLHALVDEMEIDGRTARVVRELSVATDPWILDHAIEGTPVLPGVVGVELMAAAARLLQPGSAYIGARDVRFEAPAKVHRDAPTRIIAEAELTETSGELRCTLSSVRELKTGRTQRTEHFRATLLFGAAPDIDGLPSAFLPDETYGQGDIYRRFFHGPKFQVLTGIFGVSADGLLAEGRCASDAVAAGLLTEPLALESAFQAAGLHRMLVADRMGLPSAIDEVRILAPAPADGPVSIAVQLVDGKYHVDIDGLSGPILRLRGFALIDRGDVPPADRFPVPDGGRPTCFPQVSAEGRGDAREDATAWLRPDELAHLASRGTERRVADRRAGRIAAKRALHQLTGVPPHDISIHNRPDGAPVAHVPGWPGISVSISHRAGIAIALATTAGQIGVDLEEIEARPASFGETWFLDGERALATDPTRETAIWAVKEAVMKALGTGLALPPQSIEVTHLSAGTATIALRGPAIARLAELGGGSLSVAWSVEEEPGTSRVIAQALLAA